MDCINYLSSISQRLVPQEVNKYLMKLSSKGNWLREISSWANKTNSFLFVVIVWVFGSGMGCSFTGHGMKPTWLRNPFFMEPSWEELRKHTLRKGITGTALGLCCTPDLLSLVFTTSTQEISQLVLQQQQSQTIRPESKGNSQSKREIHNSRMLQLIPNKNGSHFTAAEREEI